MKMSLDLKCSRKGCKHHLKFSCDATTPAAELERLATEQGWLWGPVGDVICPEHKA